MYVNREILIELEGAQSTVLMGDELKEAAGHTAALYFRTIERPSHHVERANSIDRIAQRPFEARPGTALQTLRAQGRRRQQLSFVPVRCTGNTLQGN